VASDQHSLLETMVEHACRAIELDPKDSLGHSALGLALMERGEFDRSAAEHDAALASNPNSPFGHFSYGYLLNRTDRFAEALERFDAALRLNPRDPANWSHLTLKAGTLYLLGRYDEAALAARNGARSPTVDLVWPHIHLAAALGQLGRAEEASAAVAEVQRQRPGLTLSAFAAWSTNQRRSKRALDHIVAGLRKSGMTE
jgi:tetratricopeptide (TPR) repeat protein